MKIIHHPKDAILAQEVVVADTALQRLKGLLGRKGLKAGQALLLRPCNSIHTFFMRFPIDVIFVDKNNQIVKTISCLKPWRLSGIYFAAQFCIELPAGTIDSAHLSIHDTISLIP